MHPRPESRVRGRKDNANAKGRNEHRTGSAARVLIVRRSLIHSPQFSALSPASKTLFWELHSIFNGTNRENVFLSVRDAAGRLGLSCLKAVSAAFDELEGLGFIQESIGSSFRQKYDNKSRARAWRLMWIGHDRKCAGPECLPELDFKNLDRRQKMRVQKRSEVLSRYLKDYSQGKFAVEDSSTLAARGELAVEDSSTLETENRENPPIRLVEDSSTHIEYHGGLGSTEPVPGPHSGWWASISEWMATSDSMSVAA